MIHNDSKRGFFIVKFSLKFKKHKVVVLGYYTALLGTIRMFFSNLIIV